ncbi:MAG: DUF2518 family protein [Leptolyngbyaceae cyanobacterium SM1_3_5]|nr:DUF2518 family protein [Leptolyngbyaceae cyanobacterium SM1_3_5]
MHNGQGIATAMFAGIAVLSFLFKWGIRFQMIGVTGFTAVLAFGLFALGLEPFTRTVIPGAVQYATVYDGGGSQVVIVVPQTITETELEATLKQAAGNFFSLGRTGQGQPQMTIRARTVLHPEPGVSQPLVLGQIKRSLASRTDDEMKIEIYRDRLAQAVASDVMQQ